MKTYALIINKDEINIKKINKKELKNHEFQYMGNKYAIDSNNEFIYEKKGLLTKKVYKYYIYQEGVPVALINLNKDLDKKEIQTLMHTQVLKDLFLGNKINLFLIILFLIIGILLGFIVGVLVYPHAFPVPTSPPTPPTNVTK
ncbi:MAG: hypothetical protein QXW35_05730 [Candidatus Aenigmatarchaeota archaeon]